MNKVILSTPIESKKRLYLILLSTIFSIFFVTAAVGQEIPAFMYYSSLSPQTGFPKELQSKRSAVIVNIADDWKKFATEAHEKLRLMSIDPVLYVDYRDLMAGDDATGTILAHLNERKISYLLTFTRNEQGLVELNITDMAGFLKPGQQTSYRYSSVKLPDLLKYVANELIKAELKKSNFLVAEKPEFLEDINAIKGRKFEVHARDLATLKLAVPKFKKIDQELIDKSTDQAPLLAYNRKVDNWNQELVIILSEFPYKYELVETIDARELYRQGFQYALFNFHTKGVTIKKMLNMKIDDSETEYITNTTGNLLKRQSTNQVVSKFYVKHLYTNDIYTGDKWDADETWQQSLTNYLYHYRKFVGK